MHPYLAEFVGTALLVLLGDGVVANVVLPRTKGNASGWIVIALGWGMAVFVAVWCVGEASGAHINPAVTLGLYAAGKFPIEGGLEDVAGYILAQFAGAFVGATLVLLMYWDHYVASNDSAGKLATFCTAPAIRRTPSNLFSEIIGTAVLVLAVLLAVQPSISMAGEAAEGLAAPSMKIGLGSLGALPVGLLVLSIGLSLGGTTGYAINPARDLSPRLVHALLPVPGKGSSDWGYAWIPVIGPLLGGLLAAGIWMAIMETAPQAAWALN
jgi:glycerol uptake facilitator protein